MTNHYTRRNEALVLVLALSSSFAPDMALAQTVNDDTTVTVLGNEAEVLPDGSFSVLVPVGPFGSGLIRASSITNLEDSNLYGVSEFFELAPGEVYTLQDLLMSPERPPTVVSLRVVPQVPVMTMIGQLAKVDVLARLSNNTTANLSRRQDGTTYWSSNSGIASIGVDGAVMAHRTGTAVITASWGGWLGPLGTAMVEVDVRQPTEVTGFVIDEMGGEADLADVTIFSNPPVFTTTSATGMFAVPNVLVDLGETFLVEARKGPLVGVAGVTAIQGGFTDAGLIRLGQPLLVITFDNPPDPAPLSYAELGLTVVSLQNHLHMGDQNADGSPDLLNHSDCCSTPYQFSFAGGSPFTIVSVDVKRPSPDMGHTFTSSSGASLSIPIQGVFTFPTQGWQGITSFQWHITSGDMVIDNLVIQSQ